MCVANSGPGLAPCTTQAISTCTLQSGRVAWSGSSESFELNIICPNCKWIFVAAKAVVVSPRMTTGVTFLAPGPGKASMARHTLKT